VWLALTGMAPLAVIGFLAEAHATRVASYTAARVPAALSARASGTTIYLPQQARPGT
jgi:hypothetical protein